MFNKQFQKQMLYLMLFDKSWNRTFLWQSDIMGMNEWWQIMTLHITGEFSMELYSFLAKTTCVSWQFKISLSTYSLELQRWAIEGLFPKELMKEQADRDKSWCRETSKEEAGRWQEAGALGQASYKRQHVTRAGGDFPREDWCQGLCRGRRGMSRGP